MKINNPKKIFYLITLVIFLIDFSFVYITYRASEKELNIELSRTGEVFFSSFDQYLEVITKSMLQLASFIAKDPETVSLFGGGRQALLSEDKEMANDYRERLYQKLNISWHSLQDEFNVRQLHFHIGPGDTSFLRVHKKSKYGDDLSTIRHSIVDAIRFNKSVTGFESGRVYSGIRGVVPLLGQDGNAIGALEVGTSFSLLVDDVSKNIAAQSAVLLDLKHLESTMWPDQLANAFKKIPPKRGFVIEATSDPFINEILTYIPKIKGGPTHQVLQIGAAHYTVSTKPLYSYKNKKDGFVNNVGYIVIWRDISDLITRHNNNSLFNLFFALIGFVVVETLVYIGLQASVKKLNQVIEDQTVDLKNKNRVLDEFNRMVSHELNNPLTTIIGYCELISMAVDEDIDSSLAGKINRYIKHISTGSTTMNLLIKNLLYFTDNGLKGMAQETIPLTDIIASSTSSLNFQIELRGAKVLEENTGLEVYGNKVLLIQVMTNLISNSIKYTPKDIAPVIRVEAERNDKTVRVSLTDNGIGIPTENLNEIFLRYKRVEGADALAEGHGIGLSTVKRIIDDHGGQIEAESTLGEGSTFIITLPLPPAQE